MDRRAPWPRGFRGGNALQMSGDGVVQGRDGTKAGRGNAPASKLVGHAPEGGHREAHAQVVLIEEWVVVPPKTPLEHGTPDGV